MRSCYSLGNCYSRKGLRARSVYLLAGCSYACCPLLQRQRLLQPRVTRLEASKPMWLLLAGLEKNSC